MSYRVTMLRLNRALIRRLLKDKDGNEQAGLVLTCSCNMFLRWRDAGKYNPCNVSPLALLGAIQAVDRKIELAIRSMFKTLPVHNGRLACWLNEILAGLSMNRAEQVYCISWVIAFQKRSWAYNNAMASNPTLCRAMCPISVTTWN